MSGLDDRLELFWTVPAPARRGRATLTLSAESFVTAAFSATLNISINGHPVETGALPEGTSHPAWSIAVPPEAIASGRVRVMFHVRAAATGDRCRDKRLGGVSLTLNPASALAITLPDNAIQGPADRQALLPARVNLALPPPPLSADELALALRQVARLIGAGHEIVLSPADQADVVLSRTARVATDTSRLVLPLRPAEGPVPPARGPDVKTSLALSTLGLAAGTQMAAPDAEWHFELPATLLSRARQPTAVELTLTAGADVPGLHHVLHLFVNGALASSTELRKNGQAEHVVLPIPARLLGQNNLMNLRFVRMAATGCADAEAPLPVTLSDGGRLRLGPVPERAQQFLDIAERSRDGLDFYVPATTLSAPDETFPALAALVHDYHSAGTPLRIHLLTDELEHPRHAFIFVAPSPPGGAKLPLRVDAGPVTLLAPDRRRLSEISPRDGGIAALIRWGLQDGIWIAPPAGLPMMRPLHLEHGDLALFNDEGVVFWMNSTAPHGLTLRYADSTGLSDALERGWPFGAALAWALVTLVVLVTLARRRLGR